ncbi:hypothetical protein NDU88_005837 [Pleurodeles waltl]|uniref:Uncharacterized protein n=1 Tax=Pleurodeles waltl TaxID=8319 RepID=A0AAV7TC49_PLEWA|nr:hypothetical protein NDU88_005837 [Pleurodeles waltl]
MVGVDGTRLGSGEGDGEESARTKEQAQRGEVRPHGKRCDCGGSGTCAGLGNSSYRNDVRRFNRPQL